MMNSDGMTGNGMNTQQMNRSGGTMNNSNGM